MATLSWATLNMATIGAHYFQVCTRGAERLGIARADLLRLVGIDPGAPERPDWRGSVDTMSLLVRAIWEALDDEHMGCTGTRVPAGALAMMTDLAFRAPTVLEALEKGAAFYNLLGDAITTRIDLTNEAMVLTVGLRQPALDPDHYFTEFWMIIWHRFACWLAGETVLLTLAEFDYAMPAAYLEEFKYLFPCPHRFGSAACRLHFDRAPLAGAIVPDEAERLAMISRAPLDFMTIPASDHSLARRVRRLLVPAAGAPFRPRAMAEVAAMLAMHPARVARDLRREGTSLARIAELVRRDRAGALLRRRDATIEDIAEQLGYAEARSFTRAFRRWTGQSPLRFRRDAGFGLT